jgi:outer membrane lipoprotein-sorting protein
MVFQVQIMGSKRLVEFLAPGDMKGTKVLTLSARQMYVYTPAYNKVRRIASHVTEQGFMGTTLSDADMSLTHYAEFYTAKIKSETEQTVVLALTPKPGAEAPYDAIEIEIDRVDHLRPNRILYLNAKGDKVKTEERPKYECKQPGAEPICTPAVMNMIDHTRGDMTTTMTMTEFRVNQGLDDSMFSVRTLQQQ